MTERGTLHITATLVPRGPVAFIVLDESERTIVLPAELEAALAADPVARAAFEALAPSHRKEAARSVADAKQAQTRERRLAALIERLRA